MMGTKVRCAQTDEPIKMLFGKQNLVLDVAHNSPWKGALLTGGGGILSFSRHNQPTQRSWYTATATPDCTCRYGNYCCSCGP